RTAGSLVIALSRVIRNSAARPGRGRGARPGASWKKILGRVMRPPFGAAILEGVRRVTRPGRGTDGYSRRELPCGYRLGQETTRGWLKARRLDAPPCGARGSRWLS